MIKKFNCAPINITKNIADDLNDININSIEKKEKKIKNIFYRRKTFNYDNINSFK